MVLSSQLAFEIPTITDFSDYIAIAIGGEDFVASKNVGVVEFF